MNAIEAGNLTVSLPSAGYRRPVLDGVSFTAGRGRSRGIVGESGSGKSLLSRAILGDLPPAAHVGGSLAVAGTDVLSASAATLRALRRDSVAMVFQDPRASVNPVHRVGDFLTEGVVRSGRLSRRGAAERAVELLQALRLPDPAGVLRRYPYELSGGMLQRVVIASALMTEPSILLCDEATTALDVTTQSEIVSLLGRLVADTATTLVFVTHDLDLATDVCDDLVVLYAGTVMETGPAREVLTEPRNPYSAALLSSIPRLTGDASAPLPVIPGTVLPLSEQRQGCVFAGRCPFTEERCHDDIPRHVDGSRSTYCIHPALPQRIPA